MKPPKSKLDGFVSVLKGVGECAGRGDARSIRRIPKGQQPCTDEQQANDPLYPECRRGWQAAGGRSIMVVCPLGLSAPSYRSRNASAMESVQTAELWHGAEGHARAREALHELAVASPETVKDGRQLDDGDQPASGSHKLLPRRWGLAPCT